MELLNEIWQTARRNKLRTTLTGFAVAWGIFMLIFLLGAGNGLINAQIKQTDRFLANSMVVFGGETSKAYQGLNEGRSIKLHKRDIDITATEFTQNIDAVGARYSNSVTISNGQQYIMPTLSGVYPAHTQIDKTEVIEGRFINDIDLREKRKVLVLSNLQAKELARHGESLLGRYVNVNSLAFRVVGIYKDNQNGRADAFAPYSTMVSLYSRDGNAGIIEYSFHGLDNEWLSQQFEQKYRQRLNSAHYAAPDDESAIWLWNRQTMAMQMNVGIGIIRTALWIIGLFTLLSGIVGVSNIMLITVKERTHEFGIRKAIGAKPWNILRLIIVESIIITTLFGYVGMLLGIGANEWMDATIGHTQVDAGLFKASMFVNPTVGIDVCIEATVVMVIAGTIAGLIPAMKASRIRPIEALRAE